VDSNFILGTDSYKFSHWVQYPEKTTLVYSYLESRGGQFPSTVFFGLQAILDQYLAGAVVTPDSYEEARTISRLHFGNEAIFNEGGWQHILTKHGGRLPLRIRAVLEGTVVPVHNVLMTIENTDPDVPWLTNFVESQLLHVWYPTTVATQSREMKRLLLDSLVRTGTPETIDFKLHDFGYRGSTSNESAALGGAAHLVNFKGTDTLLAIKLLRDHYHEEMGGYSIPAAEHSTIMAWGRSGEGQAFANMLNKFPQGLVAIVSDTYDIFSACAEQWGNALKATVTARNGTVVVRPDSGEPMLVLPKILEILGDAYGTTENNKGFRVLPPCIRVIQGDGIDFWSLRAILIALESAGWSTDNITFGSGGGLLQKVNRDTCKFAIKESQVIVDGEIRNVAKTPVTDTDKTSKAGRLSLVNNFGKWQTVATDEFVSYGRDHLETVFLNGRVMATHTLAQIRERAALTVNNWPSTDS